MDTRGSVGRSVSVNHTNRERAGLAYRSDIEGLRAVAILLVVAAHAGVPFLAGGFIGVDVFFVLSGYLITGLLVQEICTHGRVDFWAFYARRFRRLLPALLVMLVGTCVLARLLLVVGDQPGQATAAAAASVWLSNFYFAFSNLGYFSPGAGTNLFLHTWSLGVEEQFYLVWPALLVIACAATSGSGGGMSSRILRRLQTVMWLVLASSLLACVLLTPAWPHFTFYMMPARAWQFALGALAFLRFGGLGVDIPTETSTEHSRKAPYRSEAYRRAGWIGLGLIMVAALSFGRNMTYPGALALVPSIGAALLLVAGARAGGGGVSALLTLRPVQAIGRVSYAWYLWHWPILLLGAAVIDTTRWTHQLAMVVLSFVLAVLSYRFIETPTRRGFHWITQPRLVVTSAFLLMICTNVFAICWHNSALQKVDSPEQLHYLQARYKTPAIYAMGCDDWYHSAIVKICAFGPSDAPHTAVAMGDSIGLQWFPALAGVFDRPGWRLLVVTKSSCPMVDEPIFYPRIGRQYTECSEWRKDALARVAEIAPDLVILGSTFTYDFSQTQWIEGTERVLKALADAHRIDILRSTPLLPFDGPACLAPRSWLHTMLAGKNVCVASLRDAKADNVYHWLQTAAARVPNVTVLDMTDVVCPSGQCRAEQNGLVVFRDQQHLSAEFARSLEPIMAKRLNIGTILDDTKNVGAW
jgi:peptidoglycan/LPS O-acetylase OafA/YrhL